MSWEIMSKGIRLLMSSGQKNVEMQFFGGEPLLHFSLVKKGALYAERLAKKKEKNVSFLLTTNGIALTPEKISFFKKHNFTVECSIDGALAAQMKNRMSLSGINYVPLVLNNFRNVMRSGVDHYAISVVAPDQVSEMFRNFVFLVSADFKRIQVNYNLGVYWPDARRNDFFRQNKKIIAFAERHGIEFLNCTSQRREPVVLNAEHTVDCNGDIFLESGICLEEDFSRMKKRFLTASVRGNPIPHLWGRTRFQNFYALAEAYGASRSRWRKIIANNVSFGLAYKSFLDSWTSR